MSVTLVDHFEQMVARYPDHVAMHVGAACLTYDQTNRLANRLAHTLLNQRDAAVILLLALSPKIPAAIFGVLKAGKYYVPLDPANPPLRLATMIRDAGSTLIVTDSASRPVIDQIGGAFTVVNIDDLDACEDNPGLTIDPHTPALLYYTSGTTGQPKGTLGTHQKILHAAADNTQLLHVTAQDRWSHVVSYSFAASRKVLFDALLNGASVYGFDVHQNGTAGLAAWLAEHRITIYCSTPSLFRHFAASLTTPLPHLSLIFVTGEPVHQHDLQLYRERFSDHCVFVNMFGSTEVGAICQYTIDKDTIVTSPLIPVGYAVHDNMIELLDGEIVVSGPHIEPSDAPGFEAMPDGTWRYHTGDLGELTAAGALLHLGRRDFQVKIRGNRVEPAEIEAALLQHPSIRAAALLPFTPAGMDEKRLVAYVVADQLPPDLRPFLLDRLPSYMLPAVLMRVDALPLAVGGKLDRAALPTPNWTPRTTPVVPPRGELQQRLAALWSDLLGVAEVSAADSFFDLGGELLLGAHLLAVIERETGKSIPLARLETHPTIAHLAELIESWDAGQPAPTLLPIKASGSRPPLFCVTSIGGYAYKLFPLARYLDDEQPLYGFQYPANFPPTLHDLAAHYIRELRQIQPHGPYALGGKSIGGIVAFEMAQQLTAAGDHVAALILFDTHFPLYRPRYERVRRLLFRLSYPLAQRIPTLPGRYLSGLRRRIVAMFSSRPEIQARNAMLRLVAAYPLLPYAGTILYLSARQTRRHDAREQRWSALGNVTLIDVPGTHSGMWDEPHVRVLGGKVSAALRDYTV